MKGNLGKGNCDSLYITTVLSHNQLKKQTAPDALFTLLPSLRWFGHNERMEYKEFVKKVYLSSDEGMNRRGRPLGRWKDRVKEYMSEREVRGNGLEWARRECVERERWRSVCCGHPLGDTSRGREASELLIDTNSDWISLPRHTNGTY